MIPGVHIHLCKMYKLWDPDLMLNKDIGMEYTHLGIV